MAREPGPRWQQYVLFPGDDFEAFWKQYLATSRNLVLILGRGFDPRMCECIETLAKFGGLGRRDCVIINYERGLLQPDETIRALIDRNDARLQQCTRVFNVEKKTIEMVTDQGIRIGTRAAAELVAELDLSTYSDVVLDVSSLPKAVGMSLLNVLLKRADQRNALANERRLNLHVVVTEDPDVDSRIDSQGLFETASLLPGYQAAFETPALAEVPVVWVPILGEGQREQLRRVHTLLQPREICPAIPSPSRQPRRGDALIGEYADLLFDEFEVEPKNILQVAESNPFEAYRRLIKVARYYQKALEPLGGCKVAYSAHSSKLLSTAAVLAAHEVSTKELARAVTVAYVESKGYAVRELPEGGSQRFSMWVAGDAYA